MALSRRANNFATRFLGVGLFVLAMASLPSRARAAEPSGERAQATRELTPEEIAAWLDSRGLPATPAEADHAAEEAPPRPPRKHGLVFTSGVGAFGHLGPMQHISPIAPWFHAQLGFEPLRWLMFFGELDLVLANTSYARPPPPPRTYALYGFGAGVRFTWFAIDIIGLYAQGSLGTARVSDDILATYGFQNAIEFNTYLAAELGAEWYQVSPHLALVLHGGLRSYREGFERIGSSESALAWVSGIGLRYTF